jgi:hypothetical protein
VISFALDSIQVEVTRRRIGPIAYKIEPRDFANVREIGVGLLAKIVTSAGESKFAICELWVFPEKLSASKRRGPHPAEGRPSEKRSDARGGRSTYIHALTDAKRRPRFPLIAPETAELRSAGFAPPHRTLYFACYLKAQVDLRTAAHCNSEFA